MNSSPTHHSLSIVTLQTATPEEGRQLAIKMARAVETELPPEKQYREMADYLRGPAPAALSFPHLVTLEYAIVASANNFWRQAPPASSASAT